MRRCWLFLYFLPSCGGLVEDDSDQIPPHYWSPADEASGNVAGAAGESVADGDGTVYFEHGDEPPNLDFSLGSHQWVNEDPDSGVLKIIDGELCLGKDGTTTSVSWPDPLHEPLRPFTPANQEYRIDFTRRIVGTIGFHLRFSGIEESGPWGPGDYGYTVFTKAAKKGATFSFEMEIDTSGGSYMCIDDIRVTEIEKDAAPAPPGR